MMYALVKEGVQMEVGVRDLRANLRRYLDAAARGEVVVVTERGKPIVQIRAATGQSRIDEMIALGLAAPPRKPRGSFVPKPVKMRGKGKSMLEYVQEQRR